MKLLIEMFGRMMTTIIILFVVSQNVVPDILTRIILPIVLVMWSILLPTLDYITIYRLKKRKRRKNAN